MKQFNLDEYLRLKEEGKEPILVTKAGNSARIICTDKKDESDLPVVALVTLNEGYECVMLFTKDGMLSFLGHKTIDYLFFAPTKHEGWINIYRSDKGYYTSPFVFETKEKAMFMEQSTPGYLTTIKIEWSE